MQSTASRLLSRSLRVRRSATKNIFQTTYGSPCRRHLASSLQSSLHRTTHTTDNSRSSRISSSRSSSAISSALDTEEEIERFTAECMQELLPHYAESLKQQQQTSLEALAALDLELGDYKESENEEDKHDDWIIQEEAAEVIEETPKRNLSAFELLSNFDPQNPPSTENLHDLELWLECQAQQEAVARYQSVIDAARQRKDYSSLSMVQKEVLHWFQPLTKALEQRQKEYMLKEQRKQASTDGNNDNNDDISSSTNTVTKNNNTGIDTQRAAKKYGPFLCTLAPEKLAVITAHAAIIHALTNGTSDGIPFVNMAKRLGEAVEEEVVIQRVLYKRFRDNQERNKWNRMNQQTVDEEGGTAEIMSTVPHNGDDENSSTSNDDNETQVSDEAIEACLDTSVLDSSTQDSPKWAYSPSHLQSFLDEIKETKPKKRRVVSYAVWKARQILEKEEEWTVRERIQLGAALFQVLLENAKIRGPGNEPAFTYEKRWTKKDKLQSFVVMNDRLQKMIVSDKLQSFGATTTRNKPMVVPPTPWTAPNKGGYKWLKVDLLRFHGCNTQREALDNGNLNTVFDGLNSLGRLPWQINKRILEVADKCWEENIPIGDIPPRDDFDVPPEPIRPEFREVRPEKGTPEHTQWVEEAKMFSDAMTKYERMKQKNMDLRSLRCSAVLKLDQADKFKDFEKIYFPYNMDFRGRAYPCTPHLSNIGSDLCRGMLKFAEAKPLGPNGLYWLKVHLANFAGMDKVTFDERAGYVDDVMDKVRASVEDPFGGERWWMSLEDPFQGLATCFEIVDAMDSGDPASFMCSLPVHMDGSCNGLQHYAALGRDRVGGKAVNLCAYDTPQDVYSGVMHEVIRRVADEAARTPDFDTSDVDTLSRKEKKDLADNRAAKLVDGLIDRGVVKRTVMTSVYGVTYIGARQQIQEKIESKLEAKGLDVDELNLEIFQASGYLARITMDVMGDLFTGAKETMNWLTTCARLISQHGYPVAWVSPIGLPAIQPYRLKKPATLLTLMQTVTLVEESDDLPIHKARQVTAFPPNFVHSLDSSHMLFTALEMDARGLAFSAVHDSFWTHACDIDEMNDVLRTTFVTLYDQPLLENQKKSWEMRYPDLEFPDLPARGELDLNEVKSSKYFFQ